MLATAIPSRKQATDGSRPGAGIANAAPVQLSARRGGRSASPRVAAHPRYVARMKLPPLATSAAFLSDIHGNLAALEKVLALLDASDVKTLFVAGDHVLGGDQPLEVWRLLQQRGAHLVRGLSDTALVSIDPAALEPENEEEEARADEFLRTREQLGELVLEQLRRLPEQMRVPLIDGREVLVVHGSPLDPRVELEHSMDDEELRVLLDDDPAAIVCCGASHVAFRRRVDEIDVVGVGSVGKAPEGRVAHFTVLTPRMDGIEVAQDHVTY